MLNEESRSAVENFICSAKNSFISFADQINKDSYEAAAELIIKAQRQGKRLHVTGIGKPGHVSEYIASLMSSTGTPCYFLHGTEAVHGSSGQLVAGDVVIAISNSGETLELKATVRAVKNNGCKVIGVTGNMESWLAKESEVCIFAGVSNEGGPLNRAPRNSIMAELLILQVLSVALQSEKQLTPQQYIQRHPGGALGKLRDDEK